MNSRTSSTTAASAANQANGHSKNPAARTRRRTVVATNAAASARMMRNMLLPQIRKRPESLAPGWSVRNERRPSDYRVMMHHHCVIKPTRDPCASCKRRFDPAEPAQLDGNTVAGLEPRRLDEAPGQHELARK